MAQETWRKLLLSFFFCTKTRVLLDSSCSPLHTNSSATTPLSSFLQTWSESDLQEQTVTSPNNEEARCAKWGRCCVRCGSAGQDARSRPVNAAFHAERVAVRGAEIGTMCGGRLRGCRSLHFNEDNGRFALLAVLILLYLLCGAAVFSAIERPSELRAHGRWNGTLLNFSETFNISLRDVNSFLREYEAAIAAGIRADALRPRWDLTGAFYFVGTVVSTIGG